MPLTQLARSNWQAYLDRVSKALGAQRVTVEVTGLGLGDQYAARSLPLTGLSYDPRDETLTVFAEGLEHRIVRPRSLHIDHELDVLHSLQAVDGEGNHHIVQLNEPLSLPAP